MKRRNVLATVIAGAAAPLVGAGRGWAAPSGGAASSPRGPVTPGARRPRLTLPAPTGPYGIGTVALHLVDRSRPDPVAGDGHFYELMASVWYPARDVRRHPVVPWISDAAWHQLIASVGIDPDAARPPLTAGHDGAPVLPKRQPVIMFSHGNGTTRAETTIVVQELASHGYVVVTVDHPYDGYSEFPDGRVTGDRDDVDTTPWTHADDVRFVLDRVEDLAAGRNPDAERRPLPAGLAAALDLRRVGMFGWSKGATATALVMNADRRVRAGLSLDGPMASQPQVTDIDRPFMLMTADFPRTEEPVARFWPLLHGWRLTVQAAGAAHSSYCDAQWLIPQLAALTGMSDADRADWLGTLDPGRAVTIQRAYPLAFFDLHLRGGRQRLLEGPSRAFPEVTFVP
jgi:predicted dienelactone hydrolase